MKRLDYIGRPSYSRSISRLPKYRTQTGDTAKTVIASTASPYKFPVVAVEAVTGEIGLGDLKPWPNYTPSGVPVPPAVDGLETAPVRHRQASVAAAKTQAAVEDYLGL